MFVHYIERLEESRSRVAEKLETLDRERERLAGRLEGIDQAIGLARTFRDQELEDLTMGRIASEESAVLDLGENFDSTELVNVIRLNVLKTLSND